MRGWGTTLLCNRKAIVRQKNTNVRSSRAMHYRIAIRTLLRVLPRTDATCEVAQGLTGV